ncbi:response regulator transcription factor [Psychroflexus sp. YR1-1]|uniref:Response regulator transcription factor n=1 Tax=Psychroflexus aurantiacus TaxID=2709310 RepID=A0A6B3R2V7_9FLAO|nr:response regulator transcription factor [Psychroflexus aurantiacus]NEV94999.1 response regulator transcription factor [Psychroflexus aurantiacus]
MARFNVYILEDEIVTQELLKEAVQKLKFNVCGMSSDAETAFKEIKVLQPDIAILDIKVKGAKTGIWLGDQLKIPVIYLTAFSDTTTIKKAISTKAAGYIVKPFKANDLFIALELAVDKIGSVPQVIVKDRNKKIVIQGKDILYAKKEDQYLILYLKDSQKIVRSSITDFLGKINSDSFIQVHRSYVVNLDHLTGFYAKEIIIDNISIPISKSFSKEVKKRIA